MKTPEEIKAILIEEMAEYNKNVERQRQIKTELSKKAREIHAAKMTKYGFGELKIDGDPMQFPNRTEYQRAIMAARDYGRRHNMKFSCRWDKARGIGTIERVSVVF